MSFCWPCKGERIVTIVPTKELFNAKWCKNLPFDVVKHILEYEGSLKYRHGRYMSQIPKTDFRFPLLRSIPSKNMTSYGTTVVLLSYKDSLIVFDESYIGLKEIIYKIYRFGFEVKKYTHVLK